MVLVHIVILLHFYHPAKSNGSKFPMSIGGNHLIWEKMLTAPLLLGRKKFKFCKHHPCHLFAKKPDFSLGFFWVKIWESCVKSFVILKAWAYIRKGIPGNFHRFFYQLNINLANSTAIFRNIISAMVYFYKEENIFDDFSL